MLCLILEAFIYNFWFLSHMRSMNTSSFLAVFYTYLRRRGGDAYRQHYVRSRHAESARYSRGRFRCSRPIVRLAKWQPFHRTKCKEPSEHVRQCPSPTASWQSLGLDQPCVAEKVWYYSLSLSLANFQPYARDLAETTASPNAKTLAFSECRVGLVKPGPSNTRQKVTWKIRID